MSALQCRKRVHLEVNRPDLARYSTATEAEHCTSIPDDGAGQVRLGAGLD